MPFDHSGCTAGSLEAEALKPVAQSIFGIDVDTDELIVKLRKLRQDQKPRVLHAFGRTRADDIAAPEFPGDGVAGNAPPAFDYDDLARIGERSHHRRPGHARSPFVEGLDGRKVRDRRLTDVRGRLRHGNSQRALVLKYSAPGSEAASLIERQPLVGRIEQHVAAVCSRKQSIKEPGAVATALRGASNYDHPDRGVGMSVTPGYGSANHLACPLEDQAISDHCGKFPILQAIGPAHLLRQLQRPRQMTGFQFYPLDRDADDVFVMLNGHKCNAVT